MEIAAQWAQFSGWLGVADGDQRAASTWLGRALEWATEAGNSDLIATVISFQGHQAAGEGRLPAMIGLSRAARRDPTVYAGLSAYCAGQEARGLAMAGAAPADVLSCLAAVDDLAAQQAEQPLPSWGYWYTPAFFMVQRGIVYRHLAEVDRRYADRAVNLLTAGTAGMTGMAGADWYGRHLVHLAVARARAGDGPASGDALDQAQEIATATRSRQLARMVSAAVRRMSAAG